MLHINQGCQHSLQAKILNVREAVGRKDKQNIQTKFLTLQGPKRSYKVFIPINLHTENQQSIFDNI